MSSKDGGRPLAERGKALEDKYFHEKDQELIRKMQEKEAAEAKPGEKKPGDKKSATKKTGETSKK